MKISLVRSRLSLLFALVTAVPLEGSAEQLIPGGQQAAPTPVAVDSFTTLASFASLSEGQSYHVAGHITRRDGAGGVFTFQKNPPNPLIPGVTYPVGTSGYLIRQGFSRETLVRAEWFGARGDGITDDQPAIQSALDAHQRVNLLGKTYGVGKRMFIGWCNDGTQSSPNWRQCLSNRHSASLIMKSNYKLLGGGRDRTTIKLLTGTNPRLGDPTGGMFDIIGSTMPASAANVVVRDLAIDVNFDGQSKAAQAPHDALIHPETGEVLTSANRGEVATLNAIRIHGPNALLENLRIVGFSSNTYHEAFVVSTNLVFKDSTVGRQCGTIRNVEMTAPGSNLEIKYRRFGGANNLRVNNPHIAEITHISVSGALNFLNHPWGYGSYSVPSGSVYTLPRNRKAFATVSDALTSLTQSQAQHAANTAPKLVEITASAPLSYRYIETSVEPANNLTVFAPHPPGLVLPPGRLVRLARTTAADYEVNTTTDLVTLASGLSPSQRANKVVTVRTPEVEYYRVDPGIPSLEGDTIRIFTTPGGKFALTRIMAPGGSCDGSWGCDPAFDPTFLGENAENTWMCEGGAIEDVHIHDEEANPHGYDKNGKLFGISEEEVKRTNGSYLHGITVSLTKNLVIRRNRVVNFMGLATFMMSWWNDSLVIKDNTFDGVLGGVSLTSFVESNQRPFQFPRHNNIAIANNYIRLLERTTYHQPIGFSIHDTSNGSTYVEPNTGQAAMPLEHFPRFHNIRFAFNRVVGRPATHASGDILYPAAVTLNSASFLRNIKVFANTFDITPDPRLTSYKGGSATHITPGYFYKQRDEKRHLILVFGNVDLKGEAGEQHSAALRDLSKRPSLPASSAYPVLWDGQGKRSEEGEERS